MRSGRSQAIREEYVASRAATIAGHQKAEVEAELRRLKREDIRLWKDITEALGGDDKGGMLHPGKRALETYSPKTGLGRTLVEIQDQDALVAGLGSQLDDHGAPYSGVHLGSIPDVLRDRVSTETPEMKEYAASPQGSRRLTDYWTGVLAQCSFSEIPQAADAATWVFATQGSSDARDLIREYLARTKAIREKSKNPFYYAVEGAYVKPRARKRSRYPTISVPIADADTAGVCLNLPSVDYLIPTTAFTGWPAGMGFREIGAILYDSYGLKNRNGRAYHQDQLRKWIFRALAAKRSLARRVILYEMGIITSHEISGCFWSSDNLEVNGGLTEFDMEHARLLGVYLTRNKAVDHLNQYSKRYRKVTVPGPADGSSHRNRTRSGSD